MVCRASTGLFFLAFASLLLAGCDNTSVAYCSGSEEFCSSFFDRSLSDEDEQDPPDSESGEVTATQAALTITSIAPDKVISAIEQQTMAQLTRQQPDLIGLWLIAATLGHLVAPEGVLITRYLDQNRAWMTPLTTATEHEMMVAGLDLLAAFATYRDPALAELAQNPAKKIPEPVVDREAVTTQVQAAIAYVPAGLCCTTTELAAAAISLCAELPHSEQRVERAASQACGVATIGGRQSKSSYLHMGLLQLDQAPVNRVSRCRSHLIRTSPRIGTRSHHALARKGRKPWIRLHCIRSAIVGQIRLIE